MKSVVFTTFIAATLSVAASADWSSQGQSEPRRVPWRPDVSLSSIIQPGEREVVVFRMTLGDTLLEEPTAEKELAREAEISDDVIVAEIVSVTSKLIDNGNWVESSVRVRVSEILQRPDQPLNAGGGIWSLFHDGGEIIVDGTKVKAGLYPIVKTGQRYLIFTAIDYAGRRTQLGLAYPITPRGTLDSDESSEDGKRKSVMNGMPLSNIRRILKRK